MEVDQSRRAAERLEGENLSARRGLPGGYSAHGGGAAGGGRAWRRRPAVPSELRRGDGRPLRPGPDGGGSGAGDPGLGGSPAPGPSPAGLDLPGGLPVYRPAPLRGDRAEDRGLLLGAPPPARRRLCRGQGDGRRRGENGLAIGALALAYRVQGGERYLRAAEDARIFLKTRLTTPEGQLHRFWRNRAASRPGNAGGLRLLPAGPAGAVRGGILRPLPAPGGIPGDGGGVASSAAADSGESMGGERRPWPWGGWPG